MVDEEVKMASCSQKLEVNGTLWGGCLKRSGRFLGENAEAAGGAEIEMVERGAHRRARPQRREQGKDQ